MGYIIKNTSGLINTKITDTGRLKMAQGSFSIKYFQIGDSEVSYDTVPTTYNFSNSFVLEPNSNSQNSAGSPQSNKQYIKYPYYVNGTNGNTYGLPFSEAIAQPIFNSATLRGFFTANVTASTPSWSAITNNTHVLSSNWVVRMSAMTGEIGRAHV